MGQQELGRGRKAGKAPHFCKGGLPTQLESGSLRQIGTNMAQIDEEPGPSPLLHSSSAPDTAANTVFAILQKLFTASHVHGTSRILSRQISDALPCSAVLDVSISIHIDTKRVLKKLHLMFYVQVLTDATAEE